MPLSGTPAPPNKRKKTAKIITDLSHVTQDEYDSEPEASEFDLGTKIRTPKDIMLEELSLLKNKGSKMFRMRQKRVEKFIWENNPDLFSSESMENFQNLVPSLGGQMMDVGGHLTGKQPGGLLSSSAPVPPPKPGSLGHGGTGTGLGGGAGGLGGDGHGHGASGEGGEGGHGHGDHGHSDHGGHGPGGHGPGGHGKMQFVKTYTSPWEKAMKGNEELTATMRSEMPGPQVHLDLPKYKSFNRSATPFGGFEKAAGLMTFKLPDIELAKEEPEPAVVYQHDVGSRPSFNRTPIGWVVSSSEPTSIHMEMETVPFDGETDDL